MTWTTPRTWTAGEALTPAHLNTHLRDNLLALRHFGGDFAYLAFTLGDQNISPNEWVAINWDTAIDQAGSVWDGGSELLVPKAGVYRLAVSLSISPEHGVVAGTGTRALAVDPGRIELARQSADPFAGGRQVLYGVHLHLATASGTPLEAMVKQTGVETLQIYPNAATPGNQFSWCTWHLIGETT